jgi:hypothetical protein
MKDGPLFGYQKLHQAMHMNPFPLANLLHARRGVRQSFEVAEGPA